MKFKTNQHASDKQLKVDDKPCVISGSILYLFKGGRQVRVSAIEAGASPSEFLYGMMELNKMGVAVELIEQDVLPIGRNGVGYVSRLRMMSTAWVLRKWCEIAFPGNRYAQSLEYLNKFSVIVAVPDAIGLALGYLRSHDWLKAKVILICMGTALKLENSRQKNYLAYRFSHHYVRQAINGCDRLLALGEGEVSGLQAEFGPLPGLELLPFAVDFSFWQQPAHDVVRNPVVLFVGNDINRDYELLVRIAASMPDVKFQFVTAMLAAGSTPKNVELINSNWQTSAVTDEGMRELYQQSAAVIIPLRNTLQPSGQSVCLQAMACGAPVVISRTKGFWEPDVFTDGVHCLFIKEPQVDAWVNAITLLLQDNKLCRRLAQNAHALIQIRYDIVDYARKIQSSICDLQSCEETL